MKRDAAPSDPAALRTLFAAIPQSVVALCGLDPSGTPRGMTASSFTPISLQPPLVSVAMAHTSTTWPILRRMSRLGISLLSHSQGPTCKALAARKPDRFADLQWTPASGTGAVFMNEAAAHLECELFDELPAGDHLIALLRITSLGVDDRREPLLFHRSRFRRVVNDPSRKSERT
ncbi:MAG: flavin reductase family protein [Mycobacterium sp.]